MYAGVCDIYICVHVRVCVYMCGMCVSIYGMCTCVCVYVFACIVDVYVYVGGVCVSVCAHAHIAAINQKCTVNQKCTGVYIFHCSLRVNEGRHRVH